MLSSHCNLIDQVICCCHFTGFASDALAGTASGTHTVPATVQALKNISNEITYDEHTHERCAPGDPSKKAFTYLVLTGTF